MHSAGRLLASASNDHTVRIWAIDQPNVPCLAVLHTNDITNVVTSAWRPAEVRVRVRVSPNPNPNLPLTLGLTLTLTLTSACIAQSADLTHASPSAAAADATSRLTRHEA